MNTKDRYSLGSLNSTKFSVMVLRGESKRLLFCALVGKIAIGFYVLCGGFVNVFFF